MYKRIFLDQISQLGSFTNHHRIQYLAGFKEPLEVDVCDLASVETDDILNRKDFDEGMRNLNENCAPGHDNCCPKYGRPAGCLC